MNYPLISDYCDLSKSRALEKLRPLLIDTKLDEFLTCVNEADYETGIEDEYGVIYSPDGTRLIKCENIELQHYEVKKGTKIICDEAFEPYDDDINQSLQSITLPDSITHIGNDAFSNCFSLESVTLPESIIYIGDYAFGNCFSLESITLPESLTAIKGNPFANCLPLTIINNCRNFVLRDEILYTKDCLKLIVCLSSSTDIVLPPSVTSIEKWAFKNCICLQSIIFPNSLTSIGEGTFEGCQSLKAITLPDSVTSIGICAFRWCESLNSIILPNSLSTIETNNFYGCSSLRSIDLPPSINYIGDDAFEGCQSLKAIYFGNPTTTITGNPFIGCYNLRNINNLSNIEIKDNIVYNKDYTKVISCLSDSTHIVIPPSVTTIGESAFENCKSLQSITLPDSLTTIEHSAFNYCSSLQSINLPDSITSMEWSPFWGCDLIPNDHPGLINYRKRHIPPF